MLKCNALKQTKVSEKKEIVSDFFQNVNLRNEKRIR